MSDISALTVIGSIAALATVLLAVLRIKRVNRAALRTIAAWSRTKPPFAGLVTVSSAAFAFLLLTSTRQGDPITALQDLLPSSATVPSSELLAGAPGPATLANPDRSDAIGEDHRERALETLRAFAAKIEGMRDTTARLGNAGEELEAAAKDSALPDVDTMMDRLRARLASNPDDVRGWMTLGWAYANTGKVDDAAAAYEAALKLDPTNAEISAALQELRQRGRP